jgi:hypothetical protein
MKLEHSSSLSMALKSCQKWQDKHKETLEKHSSKPRKIALLSFSSIKSIPLLLIEKKFTDKSKEELYHNY